MNIRFTALPYVNQPMVARVPQRGCGLQEVLVLVKYDESASCKRKPWSQLHGLNSSYLFTFMLDYIRVQTKKRPPDCVSS